MCCVVVVYYVTLTLLMESKFTATEACVFRVRANGRKKVEMFCQGIRNIQSCGFPA